MQYKYIICITTLETSRTQNFVSNLSETSLMALYKIIMITIQLDHSSAVVIKFKILRFSKNQQLN